MVQTTDRKEAKVADLAIAAKTDPIDEVITARVAAREKGVHPASIYRAVKEGRLKGSRSGNTILIRRRDLAAWAPVGHRPRAGGKSTRPASLPVDPSVAEEEARRLQREKNEMLIQLLRSWSEEGDEEEQRRAFEALKQTLDEDRMGYRKIYP
jgi:excisionase family DNA binding protein